MKNSFKPLSSLVRSGTPTQTLYSYEIIISDGANVYHDSTSDELAESNNTLSDISEGLSLLPNRTNRNTHHHLHLVVHGSKGGKIHPSLSALVDQLKRYKKRSVSIEALTQDDPPKLEIGQNPMLLVPLFLLPGTHVCNDIPKIFKRFKEDGIDIKLFPFLGSFHPWLSLIGD